MDLKESPFFHLFCCIEINTMDAEFLEACESGNLNNILNILYYHDNGPTKLLKTDPNTLDHMHYFHAVCLNGHCDVVEQLFYFDVDVNLNSVYGTPLAVACQGGNIRMVETLIKHGAKIYDPNANPTLTPFFQACKHGHLDILTFLIEEEPDVIPVLGLELLVEACREGFLDIVVLLVSKNIDINGEIHPSSPSSQSISFHASLETPLEAACSQNQGEIVQYLLQEGVEVNVSIVQKYYQVLGEAVRRYDCLRPVQTTPTSWSQHLPTVTSSILLGTIHLGSFFCFLNYHMPNCIFFLFRNFKVHSGKYRKKHTGNISLVQGDFSNACFYDIHKSWFTDYAEQLVSLDLSNNQLHNMPREIVNLPNIREINVSANNLFELPEVDNVEDSRYND
jgi:ankyrin repeat protein